MLIDTHCHLNHEKLAGDIAGCLSRARAAGVRAVIVVGYDIASSEAAVEIAHCYGPNVYAAVGVHPHDARTWTAAAGERIRALAEDPAVVAIGEIGLDYHYDFSPRAAQADVFRIQLEIARHSDLPVIIHCREAYSDTLDLLEAAAGRDDLGVMHCWAGTLEDAKRSVAMGLSLGFGGTLTFKNGAGVRECAAWAPGHRLLIETDAPYLAPEPYRGKCNEPAYTSLVAERLAEVCGETQAAIAHLTTENARRLFSLREEKAERSE